MHLRTGILGGAATVTVRCRFFARYAELLGMDEASLELQAGATVGEAVAALRATLERGADLPERPLVAVNEAHALLSQRLAHGDELAFLPPLAGG